MSEVMQIIDFHVKKNASSPSEINEQEIMLKLE